MMIIDSYARYMASICVLNPECDGGDVRIEYSKATERGTENETRNNWSTLTAKGTEQATWPHGPGPVARGRKLEYGVENKDMREHTGVRRPTMPTPTQLFYASRLDLGTFMDDVLVLMKSLFWRASVNCPGKPTFHGDCIWVSKGRGEVPSHQIQTKRVIVVWYVWTCQVSV